MESVAPIYVNLASESDDPDVTQIESLCMKCFEKGVTKLLLTKIPHYKEVIITSFECPECGEKNNGIQTSSFQDYGIKYELQIEEIKDLSRQVVKSDAATLFIPSIDFSIPAGKGEVTTVEGLLSKAVEGLNQDQRERQKVHPELYEKIQDFIPKLENLLSVSESFAVHLDDPSGNSFIENPFAPQKDPQLIYNRYQRTSIHNQQLGIEAPELATVAEEEENASTQEDKSNLNEEVLQFSTLCCHCSRPSVTKMKVTAIPHFKEVVIMATECEFCGHRTNEVKSGSGIEPKGKKYKLLISTPEDLARDVLKSETCGLLIPELELDVGAGIFVGKFSTVEGLLEDIKLDIGRNSFLVGDSASTDVQERTKILVEEIEKVNKGERSIHLILDDPAGNSFVQNATDPELDTRLTLEVYERTFDQNEDLGLNDMITENYGEKEEQR